MSQIPLFSLKPDGIPENSLTPRRVSHGISPWPSSACSVHVWPETGKVKQIFFKASLFIADFDHFFGQTTSSKIAEEITRKLTTIQLFLDQDGSVPADDNFMNTPLGTNVRISSVAYLLLNIGILVSIDCIVIAHKTLFNSLRPSDAYMRRWTGSSLVQIMACRLFGAKPLSEPMLEYC